MRTDGPPIKFVAIWGAFALLMLLGHAHLVDRGAATLASYQVAALG